MKKMENQSTNINIKNNGSNFSGIGLQSSLWISTSVINFILITISLWIILTVLLYGFKFGKFTRKEKTDYTGGIILKLLLTAATLVLPRLITTNVVTWIGFQVGSKEDFECEIAMDASVVAYFLALLPAYFFLWARQKCLYQQPSISRHYNTVVKVLSWGSLSILLLSGIGILILFILPISYRSSPNGCVLREEEEDNGLVFYILLVVLLSGQFMLLGLFIYPLCLHKNVQVSSFKKEKTDKDTPAEQSFSNKSKTSFLSQNITTSSSPHSCYQATETPRRMSRLSLEVKKLNMNWVTQHGRSNFFIQSAQTKKNLSVKTKARLTTVMRRSIVCAIACVLSDLFAIITVNILLPRETPKSLTNTCFDFSLLMNIICLIFSMESYRAIFKASCQTSTTSKKRLSNTFKSDSLKNDEQNKF